MKLAKRDYKPFTEDEKSIRNDAIFKIVFGSNDRSEFLKSFLESILHKTITNIVIRNDVALDKTHADNKLMRLDVLAEIDGKEKINIEMQNRNEYNIYQRSDAYASGIYYNSLKVGDEFIDAKKTIVIWVLGFNLFKEGNYHEIGKMKRDFNNEVVSDNVTFHYIQLPRFLDQVREIKTPEEQWLAYLSCSLNKEEKEELFKMNRTIEEINKIVDIVMEDQDVQNAINDRILAKNLENLKMARAYENGEESGEKKSSIKIAKEMLKKGYSVNEISELTNLDIREIKDLAKS